MIQSFSKKKKYKYTYNSVVDGVHDSLGYMALQSQMKNKLIFQLQFFLKSTVTNHIREVTFIFKFETTVVEITTPKFYHITLVSLYLTFL